MAIEFKKGFECWFIDSEYKYHDGQISDDGSEIEIIDSIFTIDDLEQIITKMKELRDEKQNNNNI